MNNNLIAAGVFDIALFVVLFAMWMLRRSMRKSEGTPPNENLSILTGAVIITAIMGPVLIGAGLLA